ncbi:hypothetical protein [Flavobacterium reichenbachii]|uniref:Uncharacterized protein n=1 Tax=Flavobacterium reichenbachii TaxID=362418 RepID=A0A085ZLU4_9FLAO|nr:hypothetical protein [Flavobacterium reichenbachii]KFF05408.1 hypothetical protein IW19_07635 [Flavobacterium reichenbachii]OXB12334.1 hypothetical protein B0A68_19035 [Flavobacterium reichenbachii]
MKKTPVYQIFGSENSLDVDVVFFVEEMPETILEKLSLAKELTQSTALNYPEKVINANLAVCQNGHLVEVYKGTTDELNNSLFYTYDFHQQHYNNKINILLKRDVDLKFLRSTRMILSFLSKTEYRAAIKNALKSDLKEKIQTLEKIDLNEISSFGRNTNQQDVLKSIAFQLGQSILLDGGKEVYTKNDIAESFPELEKYLFREQHTDNENLQQYLLKFVEILKNRMPKMRKFLEYKYEEINNF